MKIHECEQGTDEWLKLRSGIPTASSAKDLITTKPDLSKSISRYAEELAADSYAGQPVDAWSGNAFTERGHELEPEARSWYEFERSVDVESIGFCTDDLVRYGCSPDGLVGDDGLLEIKCAPKKHTTNLLYAHKNKKPPTDYLAQCHMQMLVTDRSWCDLLMYHPLLPKVVIRIDRDPVFDATLIQAINSCILKRDEIIKSLQEIAA